MLALVPRQARLHTAQVGNTTPIRELLPRLRAAELSVVSRVRCQGI